MCLLEVLDHTGLYGCGHFWIVDLDRCSTAKILGQFSGCLHPLEQSLVPRSREWRKYVSYFRPGYAKIPGLCKGCQCGNGEWEGPY